MKLRYHYNSRILRCVDDKRKVERCFIEVIGINELICFKEKIYKIVAITSYCFPLKVIEFEVIEFEKENI